MALFRSNPEPKRFTVSHISWSAIIAGTLVGLMTQVTLLLLGTSIGLYSIEVSGGLSQFGGLGVGASIWWVISAMLSLFVGGWLASRFAGIQRVFDGILHGVITWAAITVLTLTVLTNIAGGILGGTFRAMGTVVSSAGQAAGAVLGSGEVAEPVTDVMDEAQGIISQVRARGGEEAVQELTAAIGDTFQDPTVTEAEKERVAGLLVQYTDMERQEADTRVDEWASVYTQAQQRAERLGGEVLGAGEQVAEALGGAALWAFFAMILGAGAAAYGAWLGRFRRSRVRI